MSQFEPQPAGLSPNGKFGSMYGGMYKFLSNLYDRRKLSEIQHTRTKTFSNFTGMGGLPYGGQILGMGAEKSNTKYGECLSVMFYHSTVA